VSLKFTFVVSDITRHMFALHLLSFLLFCVTDMENCKDVPEHDVNIGCKTAGEKKEHILSEDTSVNVDSDEGTVVAAAAVASHHLEDDEDSFEDAVENLRLDSSAMPHSHHSNLATEHESDTLQPLCSNLQDISDEMLTGTDARTATKCQDEKIASEKQGEADDGAVMIDEEALRQKQDCLTDEQKQVIF